MTFRNEYIPRDVAYEYLEKLLDDEDFEKLSEEVRTAYLNTLDENYNLAIYNYQIEAPETALTHLNYILESGINKKSALYCKAHCEYDLQEYDTAISTIDEALEIDEKNARLWSLKGKCYLKQDKKDDALECFNKSVDLNPDDLVVLVEKGAYHDSSEEYDEALECFDKAFNISGDALPLYFKIEIYDKINQLDKVEECFKKIEKISGKDLYYLFERGMYYGVHKNYEKAIEYFDKCLKINDELSSIWFMKAGVYHQIDDEENENECVRIMMDIGGSEIPTIKKLISEKYFKKIE